ncbi:retrovirus-related pol polyprotein from transposon TNT 1-94 [Tanacetum coccineum]
MKSSPICLLSKVSKNKSWLWHRHLNYLNFGTINDLARKDLVRGLPRLKFKKDHLCSACQLGKSKKHTYTPKTEITNLEILNTLHMDLCGPIRVQTINGKKYILVIVDDYSRFTWVKFLRSKDETLEFVIKFLKQIQVGLNKTVRYILLRTPQQNNIVKRRNRTLVEAARSMLIFSKALMFLWEEAVATAFFGALCYPTNDSEDLGKLQPTGPAPKFLTPGQISLGLVPNLVPAAPYVPPTNKELEILFLLMFDKYLEAPRVERLVPHAPAVHVLVNSAGTPSSTTIDQDAPFASHSPSSSTLQSPSSHQGVSVGSTIIEDNPFAHVDNDPFVNVFAPEPSSESSSSEDVSSAESTHVTQAHHHLGK